MRHAISFSDLSGRKVGVLGLGVEGRAARDRLESLDCEVLVVDDDPTATGEEGVRPNDETSRAALAACEAVVKAPGISRYRDDIAALERRVPVLGGVGMWLEEADREHVVAVTGTKGKSTVTTLIAHLATQLGRPAVALGNLGTPPFAPGQDLRGRLVVLEVSSFQATDVAHSPPLVAITELGEDHLDWHGTVERYHADKLSLSSQPGARRTIVADTPTLRSRAGALGGESTWVEATEDELARLLGLAGRHGARNAAIAVATLRALSVPGSDDPSALAAAARGYVPLPGRFREVASARGIRFIDDSLATNTMPTIAAIAAVGDVPLSLIVGGFDRGVDYRPLAAAITSRAAPTYVVTLPDNGPAIAALLGGSVPVEDAADVAEAVALAARRLGDGGVVLLSPAAPSFSQFRDWKERSTAFASAVAARVTQSR